MVAMAWHVITTVSSVAKKGNWILRPFAWTAIVSARSSCRHERVLPAIRKNRTVIDYNNPAPAI